MSESGRDEHQSDRNSEAARKRPTKRRRTVKSSHASSPSIAESAEEANTISLETSFFYHLLQNLAPASLEQPERPSTFEQFIEPVLQELVEASAVAQVARITSDANGHQVIPMSRLQSRAIGDQLESSNDPQSCVIRRRLSLHPDTLRRSVLNAQTNPAVQYNIPVTPLTSVPFVAPHPDVLDALYSIESTPYNTSFLRRLQGYQPSRKEPVLVVDWDSRSPWMDLMRDIRDHHALMHPDREQPIEVDAPVEYSTLQAYHLDQVHDLLRHTFWDGIDVSDALQYSPEQCTVVAMYKNLVVGVALLSSPLETYITYLAVKPGWDNAHIATTMLYHLISLNPRKDIILHVSINNPAVLLYNRFGFKAEEFIVGFYEDYLDAQSRASKNAFRLRLRQF
ncbi:hypothetical protein NM688_g5239 [Phlebia brevispora]|uniref:Uncharacterized protein n=1 Tax=Phlebia brevispora TaxID=194682 RepID=A0ACC1SYP3_9APHY|nr:hypothetical protein NM688_g5239 [Phlebia brevispora]